MLSGDKMKRIAQAFAILLITLLLSIPVLALQPPDSYSIDSVDAYTSLIETNDQLYLVKYTISYTTYPVESAADTIMFRLRDTTGTIILNATTPYNNIYFHTGYGQGIVSMYFSAADVATNNMTWMAAYTVTLEGNPGVSYNGTSPNATSLITAWWTDGAASALASRIIYFGTRFSTLWGYQLIDSGILTSYGENYFTSTIPNLRSLTPTIFSSYMQQWTRPGDRTFNMTNILTWRNQWIGTWLDLTVPAADWGIDAIWLYGMIWVIIMIAILYAFVKFVQTTKPMLYLIGILIAFGTILGFLPWIALGLEILLLVVILVNALTYRQTS